MVQVLSNLVRSFPANPSNLLELRALATPEAAKAVRDTLQKSGASKKDMGTTIQRVVHDQCVHWCWTEENPDVHRERRMYPLHPCLMSGIHRDCMFMRRCA